MKRSISCNSSDSDGSCHKRARTTADDKKSTLDLRAPETTPDGQLSLNPNLTMEEATLFAKREYNRRNAARARHRSKGLQDNLQQKVYHLAQETDKLNKEREKLEKLVSELQTQNRLLMENRNSYSKSTPVSSLNDTLSSSLPLSALLSSKDYLEHSLLQNLIRSRTIKDEQATTADSVRNAMLILGSLSPGLHPSIY